ncbi:MAG: cytochrome c [Acidimicrobiia bacterium]|nr:cytochrome c [Acidimicrobiia bacterium]
MTDRLDFVVKWVAVAVVAAVVIVGCSENSTPDQSVPETEADAAGSLGAEVYANSCASCHGADLRGTDKGPSQLSIVYEPNHHPDDAYRSAIANGAPQHHWTFGDMPPLTGLTGDEVEAVIVFIRAEQERQGFEQ